VRIHHPKDAQHDVFGVTNYGRGVDRNRRENSALCRRYSEGMGTVGGLGERRRANGNKIERDEIISSTSTTVGLTIKLKER
jgi:hypothetical protein